MARKHGPERQQWKGIDANERAFGTVRNALVGIILDGVAGVSPEIPGEGRRMISPEDADRYIAKGRQVLADFESQAMAPGGARGHAQKWMDRTIDELRRLVGDAEAVRAGKKPQKQTPESYGELRKSLGVGETGKPVDVDRWWSALPPGVESKIDCSDAKAMVDYRPYQGTPYDVSRSSVGSIEVCFASLKEARRFFDQAISSGHIELAELREDAKGHPRGRLIDEFNDNPIVGEARRYPQPKLPPRQFVAPRVRDFNTLDDLIIHARDELGATHVSFEHGTHGNVIYFPRKDGQYEAASTWQKAGYWHAQGPGSREIVRHLPRGAQAIGGGQPEHESGQDESWSYDDDSEESKRRRGVTSEARRIREAPAGSECPPGSQAYMVGYIHKISPSPQDVWGPVCLNDNAFSDGKTLGAALRKAHVLIPGGQVRQFRIEGDKVIVFPSAPGMTTYWHSIILTAGVQDGGLREAPRTQWPDWMILESVEKGHGMSPQAKDRAFELIDLGYIDATGTWQLTAKGKRALTEQATRVDAREGHSVRDYIAIDSRDRTIAGPFKSYSDARQAAGTGGAVQFVPTGRSAPPRASEAGRGVHRAPERAPGARRRARRTR
jgi:hypothetical protein